MGATRDRIVREAMRLFGRLGYRGTTIARIEAAAGLSPGSGSLYRHFDSKESLLLAGVETHLAAAAEQARSIRLGSDGENPRARAHAVLEASIGRLDAARDLVHLLLREHDRFPDLLGRLRDQLMTAHHRETVAWLRSQPEADALSTTEASARAAVAIAAVSHYWFLRDSFGVTPFGVGQDAFIDAAARLLVAPPEPPRAARTHERGA